MRGDITRRLLCSYARDPLFARGVAQGIEFGMQVYDDDDGGGGVVGRL